MAEPKSESAHEAINFHIDAVLLALKNGKRLDPKRHAALKELLEKVPPQEIKSESSLVETKPATLQRSTAIERVREYKGAWANYVSEPSLKEFEQLSKAEIEYIDKFVNLLKSRVASFRVRSAKPMGTNLDQYSEDFRAFDLFDPHKTDWVTMDKVFKGRLSDEEYQTLVGWRHQNTISVIDHPADSEWVIMSTMLNVAPNQGLSLDARGGFAYSVILLKKDEWYSLLKNPETIRLMPFVVKNLAAQLRPDSWPFFDYSMMGEKVYGQGQNPQTLFLLSEHRVINIPDSRMSPAVSREFTYQNSKQLGEIVLETVGSERRRLDKVTFGLSGCGADKPLTEKDWNPRRRANVKR